MLARRPGHSAPLAGGAAPAAFALHPPRTSTDMAAQASVAALFQAVTPLLVQISARRDPRAILAPGTIVAFAHKRDLDVPALIATLLGPSVWPRWLGRVTFVGSADLYLDGFLGLYFPQLGPPLRRLLYRTNLGPVLRALRIVPVGSTGTQMVAEWLDILRAVYPGDTPLSAVLSEGGLALVRAAGAEPSLRLTEARRWRYERLLTIQTGNDLISTAAIRRLRIAQAYEAPARLAAAIAPLRAGGALVIAPEGQLTPDGALQPLRSGLYHLLRAAPEARVLPIATTYDLMPAGRRPRLFLNVGAPRAGLAELPRREAEAIVHGEFGRLSTVTLAHLVARIVFDDPRQRTTIPAAELAHRVASAASQAARAGQPVDPALLARTALARRFDVFMRRAQRRGLNLDAGEVRVDRELLRGPVNGWQENPLGYAYNESRSFRLWQRG